MSKAPGLDPWGFLLPPETLSKFTKDAQLRERAASPERHHPAQAEALLWRGEAIIGSEEGQSPMTLPRSVARTNRLVLEDKFHEETEKETEKKPSITPDAC